MFIVAGDDHSKTTCLIIVFYGMVKRSDQFLFEDEGSFITTNEIWQYFTADKCEMLKNKPKLFFFQVSFSLKLINESVGNAFFIYSITIIVKYDTLRA